MTTTRTRGSRTPATDQDPSDDSPVDDDLTASMPGFKTTPSQGPDPLDPDVTTMTDTSPGGSDGGNAGDVDAPGDRTTSTTATGRSSKASTDALPGLQEITHTLVALASMLVRTVRARTLRRPLPAGAWVADDEDQAAIGDPLARIAARHAPIGGNGSDDIVDGVAALVGATGYAMKGLAGEAPELPDVDHQHDATTVP